jgi:hypothetical protein
MRSAGNRCPGGQDCSTGSAHGTGVYLRTRLSGV